jgi:hypothetical protein
MKKLPQYLLAMAILVATVFFLPLLIGVWIPDIIAARINTLAEQRQPSGHLFRVIQY